jgi:twitching motility protein PilT
VDIKDLLKVTIQKRASDLHLTDSTPPVLRIDGSLHYITDHHPLTREELKKGIYGLLNDSQKEKFEKEKELDFSLGLEGMERFRVNVHIQRGSVEAAFRRIPVTVPTVRELGLPTAITNFADRPNGLVLICGPTGSGKTTTLAAMINHINESRASMITMIEDPIEYVHRNKRSIIKQREVFSDTHSFSDALKRCLRQDPDVIVVGEMRDLETISTALTAAETGHLVLATLHTPDAPQTVERIIDVFPSHQQQQVRIQLSACLQGIVCQSLMARASGVGRVLASEILVATAAVRNLIREQAVEQIPTAIQTGMQHGMHTMDASLKILYQEGIITYEEALTQVRNLEEFKRLLERE